MSVYNLAIAWSGKDALADTNPDKVISGGDFNTEFLAVKTAVNSKADLANTSQIITAATASAGTDTNQVATTAFVEDAISTERTTVLGNMYPVGSIFTTTNNYADAAAVASALGVGTWVAYAAGRVLVGVGSGTDNQPSPETVAFSAGATGGEYNHTLTTAETPAHTHSMGTQVSFNVSLDDRQVTVLDPFWSGFGGGSARATGSIGSGDEHNNLQPYVVVYMWNRTA
tara:strand:- start:5946 stop:6629 length:684 start_codon:yes stop_codon:yes gene_type:complete